MRNFINPIRTANCNHFRKIVGLVNFFQTICFVLRISLLAVRPSCKTSVRARVECRTQWLQYSKFYMVLQIRIALSHLQIFKKWAADFVQVLLSQCSRRRNRISSQCITRLRCLSSRYRRRSGWQISLQLTGLFQSFNYAICNIFKVMRYIFAHSECVLLIVANTFMQCFRGATWV